MSFEQQAKMHHFSTSFEIKVHSNAAKLKMYGVKCVCVYVWARVCTSQWVGVLVSNTSYYHHTNYPRELCANKSF